MSVQIGWDEILLRLVLTLIAGAVIGLNRGEHGRAAGLRTTMLVCLAASLSMIQVNLMLGLNGKSPSSFVVMDLMRLPLGILTGVGFIGAGAILRKDNLVMGVTTAATLWYVTVVGLCLGGGQLLLGMLGVALGCFILWLLKAVEQYWHQECHGTLTILSDASGPDCPDVCRQVESAGGKVNRWMNLRRRREDGHREQTCEVVWKACPRESRIPLFVDKLLETRGVLQVEWKI